MTDVEKMRSDSDSIHRNVEDPEEVALESMAAGANPVAPPPMPESADEGEGTKEETKDDGKPPYSSFSKWKKRGVVLGASGAAVFSTLTAQTYLPALKVLSNDFDVSVSKINLTVTTYLVFQGVTPMFLGSFADRLGRRPAYIICFVVYLGANIGLALAPNYGTLLGLRCLQAAGISGTQSLCQAVVADTITSAERGQYIGFVTLSAILGPSLGPIIGGGLTDGLGWRSIFWFLAICAIIILVLMLLFFPETCRPIVGDGSIVPPKTNQTVVQLVKDRRKKNTGILPTTVTDVNKAKPSMALKDFATSIQLLWHKELGLLLLYGGVLYSGINAISAALPTQFNEIYGFNSLEVGLMFLPMAVGSVIAVAGVGKAINWNYRRHAKKLGMNVVKGQQIDLEGFPIERARLEVAIIPLYLTAVIMIGWGWTLQARTSIAVPIVLSFLMGVVYISVLNVINTLITDLYRKKAGAAVAANWFVRCMFGALMTAVIEPLILAVGSGWAYTILGGAYVVFSPILYLIMWKGVEWRRQDREKEERKLAAKGVKTDAKDADSIGTEKFGSETAGEVQQTKDAQDGEYKSEETKETKVESV